MNAEKEEKRPWPWWLKAMLLFGLIAFVAAYAVARTGLTQEQEKNAALKARHTVDSVLIVQLMNVPPDTVVEVQTITDTLTRWRTRTVTDTVTLAAEAPPCPICNPVTDTLYVDVLQVDTVVHTVEVVTVVAKRNWWEFAIVGGLSFAGGYFVGDSDRPEQICVEESEGFCQ